MYIQKNFWAILITVCGLLASVNQLFALQEPILIREPHENNTPLIAACGPGFKYKHASGPQHFGGDMFVWGGRAFAGRTGDPKIGIMAQTGNLDGTSLSLDLNMCGLTIEDSFRTDAHLKWRLSFGAGDYELKSRRGTLVVSDGNFVFAEPMLIGVIPMSRHIALEIGAGYTLCDIEKVTLEGAFVQADFILGRF